MKNSLNSNQREYVFFHLAFSADLSPEIRSRFVFGQIIPGKICFLENKQELDISNVHIENDLPVLFPVDKDKPIFTNQEGTLVFHQDLLKSAFYLLSGYQELIIDEKDKYGRLPYERSVQAELNIINRPIVNEYFQLIGDALETYCNHHTIPYKAPKIYHHAHFTVTHDVDRIDKYSLHTVKSKIKKGQWKNALLWAVRWLNPLYTKNPFWSFDLLDRIERKRDIKSAYYFLHKGIKHVDSYYAFTDDRVKKLIQKLDKNGYEIGLHNTVKSATSPQKTKNDIIELNSITKKEIRGNRQHRLLYTIPDTFHNLVDNKISYDTSMGFGGHGGFKNNYCYPFKPYDHSRDSMIDIWEIPLNIMDVSLFLYCGMDQDKAFKFIENIVEQIIQFNGIITILFHPEFLDEEERPGIGEFYETLLDMLISKGLQNILPADLIDKTKNAIMAIQHH